MSVKIKTIEISDFRAFTALSPASISVDGQNLLVWGENGSGKSSIYRALRGLFSVTEQDIAPMANAFSDPSDPKVGVTLTDGTTLEWTKAGHPTASVIDSARKSAFLSHSRLVEMSRGNSASEPPNLFSVAVEKLLADFEATVSGGARRTVAELWKNVRDALDRRVEDSRGRRRPSDFVPKVKEACDEFNIGLNQALTTLETHTKPLIRRLLDVLQQDGLELVGFAYFGVSYDEEKKELKNPPLTANVKFRTHTISAPASFLNEARLSALAIAIYLAGRLTCVPTTDTALKLLVLDDLLISLDYSHRRPVLDVIKDLFKEWQIALLTHDRFWFELAREQVADRPWKVIEVFEKVDADGLLRPIIWETKGDLVEETLDQARRFLAANHPAAAANYARTACELTLRRYCRNHGIKFGYTDDAQKIKMEDLLQQGKVHAAGNVSRKAAFQAIETHKRLILNPLSHNPIQPVVKADVEAAIAAVEALLHACRR